MIVSALHNPPRDIADAVRRPEVIREVESPGRGRCEDCGGEAAVTVERRGRTMDLCAACAENGGGR